MGNIMSKNHMKALSTSEKKDLTVKKIADILLEVFPKHVGAGKGVTKEQLFEEVFEKEYEEDNLADYVRWNFIKKAMNKCRKETKCFIVSYYDYEEGSHIFYVAKNKGDATNYKDMINAKIKSMQDMAKRADKAVNEQWYKKKWELPSAQTKKLEG